MSSDSAVGASTPTAAILTPDTRCTQISQNWWLSVWSDATVAAEAAGTSVSTHLYLAVYFILGISVLVAGFGSGVFITIGTVNAARLFYDDLATKVRSTTMHDRRQGW